MPSTSQSRTCLDSISGNSNKMAGILCDFSKIFSKPMWHMLPRSMIWDKTINSMCHMSLFRNRNVKIHARWSLLQQISFWMICEARLPFKHSNGLVKTISRNSGRQSVENSLLDLDHLEFNHCVLSLAIHRHAWVSSDRLWAQLKSKKLKHWKPRTPWLVCRGCQS